MPQFKQFADAVHKQFVQMQQENEVLYLVDITKDQIWDKYLSSFKLEDNPIYRERTEHDCSNCKNFIKNIGTIVAIKDDNSIGTIWDNFNVPHPYNYVTEILADYIKTTPIISIFKHKFPTFSVKTNYEEINGKVKSYNHFYGKLLPKFLSDDYMAERNKSNEKFNVYKRGLIDISLQAIDTVLELISSNNLYRGKEFETKIKQFKQLKLACNYMDSYIWKTLYDSAATIRNSVIGTLLLDLSNNMSIEKAVKSFEQKTAPTNYKRPKAIVTESMIKSAIKEIDNLGIRDTLQRRHAVFTDISINDILFVDRSIKLKDTDPLLQTLGITSETKVNIDTLKNVPEISIDKFISEVLPQTTELKLATLPDMEANKIFLAAPVTDDIPNILQWDNNFTWSYEGNVTDSDITKNVAEKGGQINGILRFSLQWNDSLQDKDIDLDAHCNETINSKQFEIYYGRKQSSITKGILDIDIIKPSDSIAIENIVWQQLKNGTYKMFVHNFSSNSLKNGFKCEIVFNNTKYTYHCKKRVSGRSIIDIATVTYKNGQILIQHHLEPKESSIAKFIPIDMIMLSPNHWIGNNIGNKHYIFVSSSVTTDKPFRGLYNEFLNNKYQKHKKAFDLLASKLQCTPNENGISGYGFSETKKINIFVKTNKQIYKIKIGK